MMQGVQKKIRQLYIPSSKEFFQIIKRHVFKQSLWVDKEKKRNNLLATPAITSEEAETLSYTRPWTSFESLPHET